MTTLQLTIPAQFEHARPGVRIRPREVQAWLDDLPYLDGLRATRSARRQLRLLNRQPIAPGQRLQILDAFQRSYRRLQDAATPDPEAAGELAVLLRHLSQELAFGYKIAVNDLVNRRSLLGKGRQLGPALCGALESIGLHMTHYFDAYQTVPRALWCESVRLFRFAKQQRLDRLPVRRPDGGTLSAARAFLTTAVLRAADPYRLPTGLAWPLRAWLAHQIGQGCLEVVEDDGHTPVPLTVESRFDGCDASDGQPLQVDVWQLLERMEADAGAAAAGTVLAEFTDHDPATVARTLRRLAALWRNPPQRRDDRSHAHQRIEVVTGLEAAWYMLNRRRPFDPELFVGAAREQEIDLSLLPATPRAEAAEHEPVACLSLDRSSGGLSLRYRADGTAPPRVGQLAALHRAGTPAHVGWVVAVCRWLVEQGNHEYELGLQYLAREARPVTLHLVSASGVGGSYQPAIASVQRRGERRVQTLITHAGVYDSGRPFELLEGGRSETLRCGELLEEAAGFERFVCETTAP